MHDVATAQPPFLILSTARNGHEPHLYSNQKDQWLIRKEKPLPTPQRTHVVGIHIANTPSSPSRTELRMPISPKGTAPGAAKPDLEELLVLEDLLGLPLLVCVVVVFGLPVAVIIDELTVLVLVVVEDSPPLPVVNEFCGETKVVCWPVVVELPCGLAVASDVGVSPPLVGIRDEGRKVMGCRARVLVG
jgi:hypothetical protein